MTPEQLKFIRFNVARHHKIGITESQTLCAKMSGVKLRAWQKWETGARKPSIASTSLLLLKLSESNINIPDFPDCIA